MIGSLRGVVLEVLAGPELLVEVAGVGYRVAVTATTLADVEIGGPIFLHVHTHVREDAIVLYGFGDRGGRACFERLLGAHGVGPALALAILSVHSPTALGRAVLAGDVDALMLVPGVGRKTAARLLLELEPTMVASDLAAGGPGDQSGQGSGPAPGTVAEIRTALAGLGYGPDEVRAALKSLPEEGAVEDLLRAALRTLAGAR